MLCPPLVFDHVCIGLVAALLAIVWLSRTVVSLISFCLISLLDWLQEHAWRLLMIWLYPCEPGGICSAIQHLLSNGRPGVMNAVVQDTQHAGKGMDAANLTDAHAQDSSWAEQLADSCPEHFPPSVALVALVQLVALIMVELMVFYVYHTAREKLPNNDHLSDHSSDDGDQPPPSSSELCVVCLDNVKSVLIVPCGHKCLCARCAPSFAADQALLHRRRNRCPVCRVDIHFLQRVFE
jgi:hypothetical protein